MRKGTNDNKKELIEKASKLGIDLEELPKMYKTNKKIKYKASKEYNTTSNKVYHFVDVKKIEIYITKTTRLEETERKYKLAEPLINYLQPEKEELMENYIEFLKLLKKLDVDKIKNIQMEQKKFQKQIPFEVKYKENFIWEIYYSDIEDKYFMMFPQEENNVETLFYLIKKQIELKKSKKTEYIYVPISNIGHSSTILKKSEIADLENYLWYFTGCWPITYEVQNEDKTRNIQVVGKIPVYEKMKSIYKIEFASKEEAQKEFKLIKALFILQSNMENEYLFQTGINEKGSLNFYFNRNQLQYDNLIDFIKSEIIKKKEKIQTTTQQNLLLTEKWILLKETVEKQNIEYLNKEKQIVTFLECRKTFFGRVSYFFKSKKKKKQEIKNNNEQEKVQQIKPQMPELDEKETYNIEYLLKVCNILVEKEKELKNMQMDIKALENKKENLERKIKNATLYINEIESHKKSIFDFWKFTNKDEVALITEAQEEEEQNNHNKIKKVFSYEDDIEDVGKIIDRKQRKVFSKKECDAIYAIYQDVEAFNIERKEKKLKKDDKYIEKSLKEKQLEYEENVEIIQEKDFDIFGSVVEDKTKIKELNNKKHREIEKDKYKVLDIHPETTKEEYLDNIHYYQKILNEAYEKMTSIYDIPIYLVSKKEISQKDWTIMDMNIKDAIKKCDKKAQTFILNRINVKENMPVIFYSNIAFYENLNNTLPEGMDLSKEVLIDLSKYELKLTSRKDFNMNFLKDEFESEIKTIQVYEYDIERSN